MRYINDMEMACALSKKNCVKVQKTFLGLKKTVIYTLTNSPIKSKYLEYDSVNGLKARQILESSSEKLGCMCEEILKPAENGMFSLSLCFSQDHQFAALRLSQYINFEYRPIGEIRFAEGEEAAILLRPFVK